MCASEREWLRESNTIIKARKKQTFICKRKSFDEEVRLSKRHYKQEQIMNFWKYKIKIKGNFGGK